MACKKLICVTAWRLLDHRLISQQQCGLVGQLEMEWNQVDASTKAAQRQM